MISWNPFQPKQTQPKSELKSTTYSETEKEEQPKCDAVNAPKKEKLCASKEDKKTLYPWDI